MTFHVKKISHAQNQSVQVQSDLSASKKQRTLFVLSLLALGHFSTAEVFAQDSTPSSTDSSHISSRPEVTTKKLSEIIVTGATRTELPLSKTASSVTVLTEEDFKNSQSQTVSDVLKRTPGLDVVRSGPIGGNTSVFLRGGNSEHTLVILDGVEMNDPINPTRGFNFADLRLDNIEKIEVIRGSQSTVWGSDALGGVISITTKKGSGKPTVEGSALAGSYGTFIENISSSGSLSLSPESCDADLPKLNYSLSASRTDVQGTSAARSSLGNSEADGYQNNTFSSKINLEVNKNLNFSLAGRIIDASSELDNFGGAGGDDPNRKLENSQAFLRFQAQTNLLENSLKQTLGVSFSDHTTKDNNDFDTVNVADSLRSNYEGKILKLDFINNVIINKSYNILLGLESEQESGSSSYLSNSSFGPFESNLSARRAYTNSVFLQNEVDLFDTLGFQGGIRVDEHSKFGTATTFKLAPIISLLEGRLKIRSSYGTGFKAPSISQLYSDFGNQELNPEKSRSFDFGPEVVLIQNRLSSAVTFFYSKYNNLITFDTDTLKLLNISEATSKGLEFSLKANPSEELLLNLAYTLNITEDQSTEENLLRRPKNKIGLTLTYSPVESIDLGGELVVVGRRSDTDFSQGLAVNKKLDSYALVNLFAGYNLNENLQVFARVDNLFDEEYEDVIGYGNFGTAGYGGVKFAF